MSVEEDTCLCLWRRILALVLALLLVEEDTCLRLRISAVNIRRLIIFSSLHWFFNHPLFFCIVRACLLVCVCVYACVSALGGTRSSLRMTHAYVIACVTALRGTQSTTYREMS